MAVLRQNYSLWSAAAVILLYAFLSEVVSVEEEENPRIGRCSKRISYICCKLASYQCRRYTWELK